MTQDYSAPNSTDEPPAEEPADKPLSAEQSDALLTEPRLKVLFDGLFFFCFKPDRDTPGRCKVGVATNAEGHLQVMKIDEYGPTGPPQTSFHYLSTDLLRRVARVVINFRNGIPRQATAHLGAEDFDRALDQGNPRDFRWALDFEDNELHRRELRKRRNKFLPVLVIRGGLFYTEARDRHPFVYKREKAEPTEFEKYGRIANLIGMGINPEDASKPLRMNVRVKFRGLDEDLRFSFDARADKKYVVRLINLCPACIPTALGLKSFEDVGRLIPGLRLHDSHAMKDFSPALAKLALPLLAALAPHPGSDIRFYYQAFQLNPDEQEFEFVPVIFNPASSRSRAALHEEKGLPPLVCYAAQGGRSADLPHDDDDPNEG